MGRELQKKKNRSGIAKVSRPKQNLRKTRIAGSQLVSAQWDKTQTLAQNYKRLGLTSRLNNSTGGQESKIKLKYTSSTTITAPPAKSFNINPTSGITEAKILRSPSGRIIGVEHQAPLSLSTLDDDDEFVPIPDSEDGKTDLVRALEERSARGIKIERTQSEREQEWVSDLIAKHGDNYEAMFRDRKLNIMQQSVGDLRFRCKKYLEKQKELAT